MDFLSVDWFGLEKKRNIIKSRHTNTSHSLFFWPFSKTYFNTLNPVFLGQAMNVDFFKARDKWFVRDGKIPLKDFFQKNPKPIGLNCEFFIDKKWKALVPKPWRSHVSYYELVSIPTIGTSDSIILTGQFSGMGFYSLLKKRLGLAKKTIGVIKFSKMKKYIFINAPAEQDLISKELGLKNEKIEWLRWTYLAHFNAFSTPLDYANCLAVDLGTDQIISDDFISHFILSKGGRILFLREVRKDKIDILLSPYHGYCLERGL